MNGVDSGAAGATLLLVDDDPENLTVLSNLLRPRYRVLAAPSGERALKIAAAEPAPDLILLDVMMPETDGYAVLARLRESSGTRDIPVIFVTGLDSYGDEERGFELGAVDYITKPFRPAIVLARVRNHLELKSARDRLKDQNTRLEEVVAQRTAELAAAYEAAEAASRSKSVFIDTMSHELRTPMSGVLGMLDLAVDELPQDHPAQDYLATARDSGEAMVNLLGLILDYSRVAHREIAVRCQPLSPAEVVTETAECFAASAAEKGLSLDRTIDPGAPVEMRGDEVRLRQVLSALLDNAIKFTSTGCIEIGLAAGTAQETLRFWVRDTGIGISRDQQTAIFEPFHQVDGSARRAYGGAGLGLALASRLVDLMGGTLLVESDHGVGSVFQFSLPTA